MRRAGAVGLKKKVYMFVWLFNQAMRVSPKYVLINIVNSCITSISPFTIIIFSKYIVDELSGKKRPEILTIYVMGFVIINFTLAIFSALLKRILDRLNFQISAHLNGLIFKKTLSTNYTNIENAEILSKREFAVNNINESGGIEALLKIMWRIITNSVSLIGLLYIIFTSSVYVPLAIIIFKFLTMFLDGIIQKKNFILNEKNSENNKLFSYMIYLNSDYKYAKDVRIYHMVGLFEEKFHQFVENSAKLFHKMARNRFYYSSVTFALSMMLIFLISMILAAKHINNPETFTIGSLLMAINALLSFETTVETLFSDIMGIKYKGKYFRTIVEFIELPESSKGISLSIVPQGASTIEFKNVTFYYKGSEEAALKNVCCKFDKHHKTAIVGQNGAGKTTLIKLLLRLYEPDEGQILLDGRDICNYDLKEYFKLFSVVFQDFEIFSYPIDENISCSKNPKDEKEIQKALRQAGLGNRLDEEEHGIHTAVTSYFRKEGINFSGGELQHLAIARAVHKNAPIVIMDEPTSALDPVAEEEIFMKLNQLSKNKTGIFISHRLSSCQFCDQILVLDHGQVVQNGNHKELMKDSNGKYAELFNAQANYFVKD